MKILLLVLLLSVSLQAQALHVEGGQFKNAAGQVVVLRGVASMGMAMVYGDKANPGTYLPMTPAQYLDKALQTDATGGVWWSTAIRLNFERFPSANPARLYTVENQPYALADTTPFDPWQPTTQYAEGDIRTSGGVRYMAAKKRWRGDQGADWNPGPWVVGDVVVSLIEASTSLYRCTKVTAGSGSFLGAWDHYPRGTTTYLEDQGAYTYEWTFVAPYGRSGTTPIANLTPLDVVFAGVTTRLWPDGTLYWSRLSADYTVAQMEATYADWKAKVLDPVVQHAVDLGLYVVICEFDFGPAHHPLRHTRLLDFWHRLATSPWANHPRVLFELWNESEDLGSFGGGPGTWALQKPVIQEVVNQIRGDGAMNIVIIPPPMYSAFVGEATASPIVGTNLAYSWHSYRSQYQGWDQLGVQIQQGLASGQAIVMTEWGDDTNETDPTKLWPTAGLRAILENPAHPAAGWFAWSLSQSWYPVLFSDAALRQPTPAGLATRQWLADLHGGVPNAPGTVRIQ